MKRSGNYRISDAEVRYFAINLAESAERWKSISGCANDAGIELTRIEAVDGRIVPVENRKDFDSVKFRFNHGVVPLRGEYGCYASHLNALRSFLESGARSAVIFEDDALPDMRTKSFVENLDSRFGEGCMVVRLTTHRKELFEKLDWGLEGTSIGQCWFGPSGSAAAYWLTRSAAARLIERIVPGCLPVDVALEEAWRTGVPNYIAKPDICNRAASSPSTIVATAHPGHRKPVWYRRLGAFQYRTRALFSRIFWCIRNRQIRAS